MYSTYVSSKYEYRTTSFSEASLIFVSIKVRGEIFHQKNTNLVKFDLKEAIFSDFLNGIWIV